MRVKKNVYKQLGSVYAHAPKRNVPKSPIVECFARFTLHIYIIYKSFRLFLPGVMCVCDWRVHMCKSLMAGRYVAHARASSTSEALEHTHTHT